MPTRERPYHHGDLRAALLAAAVAEIDAVGVEHCSLRSLATALGVSPSAAYHHFADKDALIGAVALESFAMLEASVDDAVRAVPTGTDAAAALGAGALGYIAFATEHPNLFRAAFSGHRPEMDTTGALHPLLTRLLDDVAATGGAPFAVREGVDTLVWSAVHGMATLVLEGYIRIEDVPVHLAVLERTMRQAGAR